ncbi:MMPL family transporter [Hamadaea tsunoensis]|uniref:MMPL family transporter n=1 Tax=Hamadaea tsunoensis TaxID=53368 RepID=UPI0004066A3F|nr:MMPL family transporter [Hamadaea tsunoensis]
MARLLYRLGLGSVRHRLVVTFVWLAVLVAVGVGAATLSGSTVNSFKIPGQESTTALEVMNDRFGTASTGGTAKVVMQVPDGAKVTDPATAAQVKKIVADLGKLPGVVNASDPLDPQRPAVSQDQRAAYSTVTYGTVAQEVTTEQRDALTDAVTHAGTDGLTVEAMGEAFNKAGPPAGASEGIGIIVALIVLALTLGSLLVAGMNLLTALLGVGIGALAITTMTGFMDLQSTTPVLATMLGLAVGIDYALFIITRHRHELRAGRSVPEAAALAVGTAGSAVVTAGLTVIIALAGLAVAGIPFLTQMGLAAAGTIFIAVLVAVTLVPAILGFLGHRALPRRVRKTLGLKGKDAAEAAAALAAEATAEPAAAPQRGFFAGWANLVTRHRWVSLLVTVAALAVVAIPFFAMRTSLNQRPATDSTQARAQQIINDRFGPGFEGPLVVLVDGPDSVSRSADLQKQIATLPGVAFAAPAQPDKDNSAALITVIPKTGPEDEATTTLVHTLRDDLADTEGAKVYVTGTTAIGIDVSQKLSEALPIYLALVVGLAFLLLVLVFRSILVPVVGVLGFLLTIGAALGATTAVFQWGWLASAFGVDSTGPMMSLAPIIIVGILFGLAMDYQVFLVSRMHEAHAHGAPARIAVVTGFRQAAPVVLAAATIMFGVFGGFVPAGDATIKPIAFALAAGILFDAVIVRMIVVPAALALLGESAWKLPRWLRWLPVLDVEGAALERREPVITEVRANTSVNI